MSGDYSRITFDPWQDDLGVLLQQGRPLSDAEWNALTLQLRRRIHAGTLDTIGTAVVPMQTPDGFKPTLAAGKLFIGQGRMYVDGMLAENHGADPKAWNPRLEELVGTSPVNYEAQPYYPGRPDLPAGGPHLVYLDVWQREVTHIVRPDLIEKAVGVDSTTHLQTVWQVKLLNNVGTTSDCSTPLDAIPGWNAANAPSAGRLTIDTASVPGEPDPCLIPPGGGYKGLENQLYRIEIHTPGAPGTATFKWSRENASIETRVTHMPSLSQLRVESIGRDSVLRFSDGDWVEVTDDFLELSNLPGQLRRIKIGGGVDDATRTILLDKPLNAGVFPVDAQDRTQPGRHMRIKRWDQRGKVRDQNGNDLQDLDLAASTGDIVVPSGAAVSVLLEHGIIANFSLDPAGGVFKSGDYWVFAARTTDASVEELDKAPPRGIHHHYAKLGFVTFPGTISDCRVMWPPPMATGTDDHCACTVCVTPKSHASGSLTIQKAVDEVRARGGGTVCLEVGKYKLDKPVQLNGSRSLRLVGKGGATQLIGAQRVIEIIECHDVTVESLSITCRPSDTVANAVVLVGHSKDVVLDRLWIEIANDFDWSTIGFFGALANIAVRGCTLSGSTGIRSGDATGAATGLSDVRIDDNSFDCQRFAVNFGGVSVHQFVTRLRGNSIVHCKEAGFLLTGATAPGQGVEIIDNAFTVDGGGIICGLSGVRIAGNDLVQGPNAGANDQVGIELRPGLRDLIEDCHIAGNRVADFSGTALLARISMLDSTIIANNRFERCPLGLVLEVPKRLDQLTVSGNHFIDMTGPAIAGRGDSGRWTASDNHIRSRARLSAVSMEFTRGDAIFTDNACHREASGSIPDVRILAGTVAAGNNRVAGSGVSFDIQTGDRHYTVLGNLCHGKIMVNGTGLVSPWASLNREGLP